MKNKKGLLEDVLKLSKEDFPILNLLEIALEKGGMLAEEYKADKELVLIGICFMDIKLNEAMRHSKVPEHVKMASDFAIEYLKDYELSKEEKDKIINCIEAHHGKIPFKCIEAEICANADCYRFIHPMGIFAHASLLGKIFGDFRSQVAQLKYKLDEKYAILSLPKAKEELEEYYKIYTKHFNEILEMMND